MTNTPPGETTSQDHWQGVDDLRAQVEQLQTKLEKIEAERARSYRTLSGKRMELLITGLVLGAALTVPLTILGIPWIHDHLPTLVALMISTLTLGIVVALLIFKYRHRLLGVFGLRADVQFGQVVSKLSGLPRHLALVRSPEELIRVIEKSEESLRMLASWYVWAHAWRRVVILVLALLGGVGALVGASLLAEQNRYAREQLKQQKSETLMVQRAQLLDTIYAEVCEPAMPPRNVSMLVGAAETVDKGGEGSKKICQPRDSLRARQEAVLALVNTSRENGVRIDLKKADLRRLDLSGANLTGTELSEANLRQAVLTAANLSDADLLFSKLSGAVLTEVDFSGADLSGAELNGTFFYKADLSEAKGLTQSQIDFANGDEHTKLPRGLYHPAHWDVYWINSDPELEKPSSD